MIPPSFLKSTQLARQAAEKQVKPEHFFGAARSGPPIGAVSSV